MRLEDVVGQAHLVGPDGSLSAMLRAGALPSLILWGPPGVGKTTLAGLLAQAAGLHFAPLSAIFSGVKELKEAFAAAELRRARGHDTLLFVDEIHRFNRAQQDGFLPFVERGVVTLVGATTENPSFALNSALLSRTQVVVLNRLEGDALAALIGRAEAAMGRALPVDSATRERLVALSDGDGRYLLNLCELTFALAPEGRTVSLQTLQGALARRAPQHDRAGEAHYNLMSALHKAVRASDPDAALYWLARMISGGEDALFIARRLIRMASEDIGLADPTALMVAGEAARAFERLGHPEGELALAHAVIHLATAPKSNAAYVAWKAAQEAAARTGSLLPPLHSRNAPTRLMKEHGYGAGYAYDHDAPDGFSGQNHFPDAMARETYYAPKGEGRETAIRERLTHLARLRAQRGTDKDTEPSS
jgi:putative ATPase